MTIHVATSFILLQIDREITSYKTPLDPTGIPIITTSAQMEQSAKTDFIAFRITKKNSKALTRLNPPQSACGVWLLFLSGLSFSRSSMNTIVASVNRTRYNGLNVITFADVTRFPNRL